MKPELYTINSEFDKFLEGFAEECGCVIVTKSILEHAIKKEERYFSVLRHDLEMFWFCIAKRDTGLQVLLIVSPKRKTVICNQLHTQFVSELRSTGAKPLEGLWELD